MDEEDEEGMEDEAGVKLWSDSRDLLTTLGRIGRLCGAQRSFVQYRLQLLNAALGAAHGAAQTDSEQILALKRLVDSLELRQQYETSKLEAARREVAAHVVESAEQHARVTQLEASVRLTCVQWRRFPMCYLPIESVLYNNAGDHTLSSLCEYFINGVYYFSLSLCLSFSLSLFTRHRHPPLHRYLTRVTSIYTHY